MKPSHLAVNFEFRACLACRYLCSQNINKYSNKPAIWLGFISQSNIWTDHIFSRYVHIVTLKLVIFGRHLKWSKVPYPSISSFLNCAHQKYRPISYSYFFQNLSTYYSKILKKYQSICWYICQHTLKNLWISNIYFSSTFRALNLSFFILFLSDWSIVCPLWLMA